jgi:cytochrome c oxidase subunit 2
MLRFPRSRPGRRVWGAGLLVGLAALLSACAEEAPQSTFDAEGPAADQIADLSNLTFLIAAVVFVFVEVGVLFVVWKFRRRADDHDDDVPAQLHGNTKAEIGWTALPAVILVGLAIPTVSTVLDLAEEPADAINIRVVGQQWWWSYDYDLDNDGVYADDDVNAEGIEAPEEYATDIETANEMVIPAGVPVYLTIQSRDVIHSYWIPNLNGKKDAVPGRTHHLTLEAYEPGTYIGQCTEYCGLSHAYMRQSVRALPMDEYEEWIEQQKQDAAEPTGELATKGAELFEAQCTSCHLVEGVNDDSFEGAAQTSGAAPNLTHFASRGIYAGGIFNLWSDLDGDEKLETDEIGEQLERNQLEAWLRNPPAEKPLAPLANRGMPDLGLSEADIDALVAYLTSLE